jgi:hypothetical protein
MARILLGESEIDVFEGAEDVLRRVMSSGEGVRRAGGEIVAPPGWLALSAPETGDPIYVQVARIGYVREE